MFSNSLKLKESICPLKEKLKIGMTVFCIPIRNNKLYTCQHGNNFSNIVWQNLFSHKIIQAVLYKTHDQRTICRNQDSCHSEWDLCGSKGHRDFAQNLFWNCWPHWFSICDWQEQRRAPLVYKNQMYKLRWIFTVPCILTQINQSSHPAIKALASLKRYFPGLFKQWYRRLLELIQERF